MTTITIKQSRTWLLGATLALVSLTAAEDARAGVCRGYGDVGEISTITDIPGNPGGRVDICLGATHKSDDTARSAHFWMTFGNPNQALDFVACVDFTLNSGQQVQADVITLNLTDDRYQCTNSGLRFFHPPDFELGCKRVQLAAGNSGQFIWDNIPVVFSQDVGGADDILSHANVTMLPGRAVDVTCSGGESPGSFIGGTDKILAPGNIGALESRLFKADSKVFQRAAGLLGGIGDEAHGGWHSGTWVTAVNPGVYPASLEGVVHGAPAGSSVALDVGGTRVDLVVEPDPDAADPCAGIPLPVAIDYDIPDDPARVDTIDIALPAGCMLAVGESVSFRADVIARAGAPAGYLAGEPMFTVMHVFMHDPQPPEVVRAMARDLGDGAVAVEAVGRDEHGLAVGAHFIYWNQLIPETSIPLAYSDASIQGQNSVEEMLFTDIIDGLPAGETIQWRIEIIDSYDNLGSSDIGMLELSTGDPGGNTGGGCAAGRGTTGGLTSLLVLCAGLGLVRRRRSQAATEVAASRAA